MILENNYVDGDLDIKKMMDHSHETGYLANASFQQEASIDKRFKIGDPNLLSMMYGEGTYYRKKKFFFNLIRRHTNMIEGYQRQHRKSTAISPTSPNHQELADDYTKLSMWSERREGFHEVFSQAFGNCLDVGMGMLHMYNDFSNDPVSGDLRCDSLGYADYLIDPWFKKQDLSDCNYVWRRKWISKEKAKSLLPGRAKEIDKMRPDGLRDGRFPMQAEAMHSQNENLFTYDEYYYLDSKEVTLIVDRKSGETLEWEENPDDQKDELEVTLKQQPWLGIVKTQKPTVKLAITLGGKVMYNGPNLLNIDSFPFVPLLCYHEPDFPSFAWRIQGIVRNLRDAQFLYNRRRIIELDILESTVSSGYKYKVGSVTDEKVFRQTGQGFLIPINRTAEMSDVERIEPPGIPQSMIELSRSLSEDITKISGVNEELLGSADDDKAGVLSMLRQAAGLTTLQIPFDKADYSQRIFAAKRLEIIRKNWSNGKIRNILGKEPAKNFRLINSQKFDVAVEQGFYSVTQQQMEFKQLIYMRELGIQISPNRLLDVANIQNKNEIKKEISQQQQAEQEQQQMQAQQMQQEGNSKRMLDFARAQKDMASTRDLQASASEKIIKLDEIRSQTEENRTKSDLNLVEQMIKLEDMDLKQFKESLLLAEIIKNQSRTPTQEEVISGEL